MTAIDAGMSVAEVEALGNALAKAADDLAAHARVLDQLVKSAAWAGPVASKFKQQWWPGHRSRLVQLQSDLRGFAQSAQNNASEQRTASEDKGAPPSGGAGGAAVGGGGVQLRDLLRLPQDEQLALWNSLSKEEQNALLKGREASLGELDFVAPEIRYAANRQLVFEQYMALNDLDVRLRGLPDDLARRKDLYERILRNHEQVLVFDPSGDGRIAVVQGDLSTAGHVAVTVPGISNTMANYWGLLDEGKRLHAAAGDGTAVVTWLGYDTPVGVSANPLHGGQELAEITTTTLAEPGASALVHFVDGVRTASPGAEITVIGHSYGSLVTGLAAQQGLQADNVVFIGSPGVGAHSVDDFDLPAGAHVYAAEPGAATSVGGVGIGGDYVSNIGHHLHPFGAVPTEPGFGAEVLDIGNRGKAWESHDDYYGEGSLSLRNLGSIVRGDGPL